MKKLLTLLSLLAFVGCSEEINQTQTIDVVVYDFNHTAARVSVTNNGDEYSEGMGTQNYYITFSETVNPESPDKPGPGFLYLIDIYSNEYSLEKIPNGTYELDLDTTHTAGTIGAKYSFYTTIAEESETEESGGSVLLPFTDAELVVTDSEITLTAKTEIGTTHRVTYSGEYQITTKAN